jgi:prepilin-type N-terminal cleavage/methylation domain-containing protein
VTAGRNGFTLLEMVVAVALAGLLLLILGGTLRFGMRAWEAAQRPAAAEALEAGLALMRRTLEQAEAVPLAFEGGPEAVGFVAVLPARTGVAGLAEIRSRFGPAEAAVVMEWRPWRSDVGFTRRPVVPQAGGLSLAYYGSPDGGTPAVWSDQWRQAALLPRLIRVTLGRGGTAVGFVVAPAALPDPEAGKPAGGRG